LLTHDLPIVVTIADTEESVGRLLPEVERMMNTGLIAISDVQICRIQRSQATGNVL